MFLHVSVILFTGCGIPACLAVLQGGVVSQHALQVSRPTPRGSLRGLAGGGGVSRPTLEGRGLQATPRGGLQAHPPADVYCCRRYASYWIAFLCYRCLQKLCRSWGKVMFLHVSVILFTGGWYPSMPCSSPGGVVSQHALQVSRPTPRGSLRGLARGVSRPTPRGVSRPHPGVVSRPNPQQMSTAAGGTHPTGLHSCVTGVFKNYVV